MSRTLTPLSLVFSWMLLPAPLSPGQGQAGAPPAEATQTQPPAVRSAAELSIPELLSAAQQYRSGGQLDRALELLRYLLQERDKGNIEGLRLLGEIYWDSKNAALAEDAWKQVVAVQPNDFVANLGLGRVYLNSGLPRQAKPYLETAAKVVPPNSPQHEVQVQVALAMALRGGGQWREAIAAAERALRADRDNFDAQQLLTALRIENARTAEEFDRALADAERLIEIAGNALRAAVNQEGVQRLQLAYQSKLQVLYAFRQLLFRKNPDGSFTDQLLPGQEKRAAAVFSQIVDVMLRQADVNRTLARFQIVEFAAAAVKYDGGTNPRTLLDLGLLQKETGQTAAAVETFRKVLELDPQNATARREYEALLGPLPESSALPPAPTP